MRTDDSITTFRMPAQVLLHLLPGAVLTLVYTPLAYLFYRSGLPTILAFFISSLIALFPLEIGLPIYLARREAPNRSLKQIFVFRAPIPFGQMIALALGTMLWSALVFMVAGTTLVDPIRDGLFAWMPEWLDPGFFVLNIEASSKGIRITTWVLGIIFTGFMGPVIEEFYFRSYLLPRMPGLRWWAPLSGVVLMSLYHFWSPWLVLLRIIAMLPMVYAVWWKRNVYVGIISHSLLNLIGDSIFLIPLIFG